MKLVKLFIIAIALIGAIFGITRLIPDDTDDAVVEPEFGSAQARSWKEKIKEMCVVGKWNSQDYSDITSGLKFDCKNSQLITNQELISLDGYLFALSCLCIKDGADAFFKKSEYENDSLNYYKDASAFLKEQSVMYDKNANLDIITGLVSSYNVIMGALSFNTSARYADLDVYRGGKNPFGITCDKRIQIIENTNYYSSHFSRNSTISNMKNSLESRYAEAYRTYCVNLADAIIKHYEDTKGKSSDLLNDQMPFDEIAADCRTAREKLFSFIKSYR